MAASVAAAKENASLNGLVNCRFVEGDVTAFLKGLGDSRHVSGHRDRPAPRWTAPQSAQEDHRVRATASCLYISCNPATFARDARDAVAAGYSLKRVIPVDMFPHTMHIELVGLLQRS